MRLRTPLVLLILVMGLLISACAEGSVAAPKVAGLQLYHIKVGNLDRTYYMYVPPGASATRGLPLVLVYHGAGSTAAETISETSLLNIARAKHNAILVFMQGYADSWNEGAGHTPAEVNHVNDVAFTHAVLAQVESQHAVDRRRIAATGISNGALLTELLGCRLAANLTFVIPVEGELPASVSPGCHPSRPISVFEVHGTADPTIPYSGGHFDGLGGGTTVLSAPASALRWARLNGCRTPAKVSTTRNLRYSRYSGCRRKVTVTLDTVIGGVHYWPAGFGQTVLGLLKTHPARVRAAQA